ncbi:hypothetical protein TCAL_15931 [Tigriopus californicus]|uniref:Uncharacterized protein n=1 Tax=Tigriopus californicus TaxID=6832 RepID=A0A553PH85_TIGCA|nr:calphotin-like [Tigriopus californicus]TRY77035.1 hypothetical protein TCAL_15931 [Tigriopus californicus]
MNCVVVVLALSGLCAAVPEADPQLLLGNPLPLGPSFYNGPLAPLPLSPLPFVRSAPLIPAPAVIPQPTVRVVASVPTPVYTPRDCVTAGGCAVRALKDAGLAPGRFRREAEAEAEADPQFLAPYNLNPYYAAAGVPAYAPAYYNNLYNANLYNGNLYNANLYNNYPYNYNYAPLAAPLPAVRAAIPAPLPALRAAIPAPAPVPVLKAVPAPIVKTVVEQRSKPVTYTHLGAHPIQPTTVLETDTIVSHHL